MSNSTERQLLGDWTYELSMEEIAKVGGGYGQIWIDDGYGHPVPLPRFGNCYGAVNW